MRILIVSSFYPPHYPAGYCLGCQDIAEGLKARGHEVGVLAGASGVKKEDARVDVWRGLKTGSVVTSSWPTVLFKEWTNQHTFRLVCRDFEPDLVFFFDLSHVSVSLVGLAEKAGIPFAFYLADNWFAIWERDQWRQVWPDRKGGFWALRWLTRHFQLVPPEKNLSFRKAIFANTHLRSLARALSWPTEDATTIPWGVDIGRFFPGQTRKFPPVRLLYVGQMMPHKGLDVTVKALGILRRKFSHENLTLTVVGVKKQKFSPRYRRYFRELSRKCGVEQLVRFRTAVPRSTMPEIYRAHDILVFPPAGDDSLSLTLLEAMASGLAIVATPTSGNADVLRDGKNALLFPAEDVEQCAIQVDRLIQESDLYRSIAAEARETVEARFSLEKTLSAIELELERFARPRPRSKAILPEKPATFLELKKITRTVKRWLVLGTVAVTARALFKPSFYARIGRKIFAKGTSLTALLIFPVFLETFFRLAGRRRRTFRLGEEAVSELKSILIVQLADMGDVLLSGPFLSELRRMVPAARVFLAVQPSMGNLIDSCPYVDEVVYFPWRRARNWQNAFSGSPLWWWQAIWVTGRRLWKHPIDLAVSLRWNNDPCQAASLILMYASSTAERIGYHDYPHHLVGYKLTDVNRLITRGPVRDFPEHEIERQFELFPFLGLKPDRMRARMELWTTQEDERFAASVLAGKGFSQDELLIAFAPGAAWEFRRWPAARFAELGRWLQEEHEAFILIFAAPNEEQLAAEVEMGLNPSRTLNLAGRTTIRQMGALFRHCRLFIGNDSGPMHVAIAAGVPVVGLLGPGEYERFRPWGPRHQVVRLAFPCSPCSQNCLFDEPRCIRGISVEQVKAVITRQLKLKAGEG